MSPVPPWYSHTYLSLTGCSQVFSLASSLPVFFSLPLSSPFCLFPLLPPPSSPSVFGPGLSIFSGFMGLNPPCQGRWCTWRLLSLFDPQASLADGHYLGAKPDSLSMTSKTLHTGL